MLKEFCEGKVGLCLSFLVVPNGRAGSEFACRDRLLVELVCNPCDGQVLEMVGLSWCEVANVRGEVAAVALLGVQSGGSALWLRRPIIFLQGKT